MYKNNFDTIGTCAKVGERAEDAFAKILRKEGYNVTRSSFKDQLRHIDLCARKNKKKFTFDVKSRKRLCRENLSPQDELIWIECLSVSGKMGWAFSNVSFIAFEREKDFVVVPREKLAIFIIKNCNLTKNANHPSEALYCRYGRPGRKDCLTLIKGTDLLALAKKVFPKV